MYPRKENNNMEKHSERNNTTIEKVDNGYIVTHIETWYEVTGNKDSEGYPVDKYVNNNTKRVFLTVDVLALGLKKLFA